MSDVESHPPLFITMLPLPDSVKALVRKQWESQIKDAAGNGIDRAFVDDMIPHHESAIEMAREIQTTTERPELQELADAIKALEEAAKRVEARLAPAPIRNEPAMSPEEIAEKTKISPSLLAGIERGDCSRWPGGIYSRAWIREYASAIGLDAEQIVMDHIHEARE